LSRERDGDSRLQFGDGPGQAARGAPVPRAPRVAAETAGEPELDISLQGGAGMAKAGGHHADHHEGVVVQEEFPPDHVAIRIELALPVPMTEYDGLGNAGPGIGGLERAAEFGAHAQQLEVVDIHGKGFGTHRPVRAGEVAVHGPDEGDGLEHPCAIAEIFVFRNGHTHVGDVQSAEIGSQAHQPVRLRKRQWAKQHCVQNAEDRGIRADAQGEGDHAHEGEARAASQCPSSVLEGATDLADHNWKSTE